MSLLKLGSIQIGQSNTASNNFHWRNLLDGLLRLSRGNAGSPITDVMRVKADNSVEFPGGIVGGFAKEYTSPEQTITAAGSLTLTHELGTTPKFLQRYLICKTAEHGYSIGDMVDVSGTQDQSLGYGVSIVPDATNLGCRFGANASTFFVLNKTTGAPTGITNANWRLIVRAWA